MHTRLAIEGKPGATMRSGGPYDGWWNGGIRNTATFHNIIAMLTEMIGSPTPPRIPLVAQRQIPSGDLAMPVAPQEWHFRQSIDYSVSLDNAVLDYASRMRENLLFNIYAMGKHSIERGSKDTWTANPRRDAAITARLASAGGVAQAADGRGGRGGNATPSRTWRCGRRCTRRSSAIRAATSSRRTKPTFQRRRSSSTRCSRRASRSSARRATSPSRASSIRPARTSCRRRRRFGRTSWTCSSRRCIPTCFHIPGAPPTPPYDNAGWTLAFQMGVQFDRILDGSPVRSRRSDRGTFRCRRAKSSRPPTQSGCVTSNRVNNSFIALNRLLKSNEEVLRLATPLTVNGKTYPAGALYLRGKPSSAATLAPIATQLGVTFEATSAPPPADAVKLRAPRVGLWDQYGGSMTAGWTRWILEQFEFPFERVFAPRSTREISTQKYDVLVFVDGAIPGASGGRRGGGGGGGADAEIPNLPAEYQGQVGRVTVDTTLPKIREFIEKGGTVIAIGSSATNLAAFLKLADRESSRRERRAAAAHEVLHPGIGALVAHRRLESASRTE